MIVKSDIWMPETMEELEAVPETERWKLDLKWDVNSKGFIKLSGTINNLVAILEHDPLLKGRIRFNEFSTEIDVRDMPWQEVLSSWNDTCEAYLASYLEGYRSGGFADKKLTKALLIVAKENSYHPVRDYLKTLVWDNISRIETLFIDHLKAQDTRLYRDAAIGFMVMSVKRIFQPGCNLQFMPVFIGKQGAGKSSLAQVLGGKWVTNSAIDINSKDGYIALQGKWIVEIAEMNSFSKKEASSVKSYISSSTDSYRPPYAQHTVDVKRQCIFFGTTNDILCLSDSTGNRRFWPIECKATEEDAFERLQRLEANRDQLWAEAMHYYQTDMPRIENLIRKVNADMKAHQERHNQVDPDEEALHIYLDFVLPAEWKGFSMPIRKAWFHEESVRDAHYRTHSHYGDFVRNEVSAYDFAMEYLGLEPSSNRYNKLCVKFHRFMADVPGWKRLEGEHRNGTGRARIIYQRVELKKEVQQKLDATPVQPVQVVQDKPSQPIPIQTELNFDTLESATDVDEDLPF